MKIKNIIILVVIITLVSCEFSVAPLRDTVQYSGTRGDTLYTLVIDPIPNRATSIHIIGDNYTLTKKSEETMKISSGEIEFIVSHGFYLRPSFS